MERKKAVLLSDELSVFNTENPVVPFIQGGTVADADDCCAGERRQKTVHLFFCFFIHGTGGFVKEDPFRFSEEHADKSQFLLFPQGEDVAPVRLGIRLLHEMGEAAFYK